MKKLLIVMFALMIFLSACQIKDEQTSSTGSKDASVLATEQPGDGGPDPAISIRSLEQLEEMRKMSITEDEEALGLYLESVEGGGAQTREDLINFLELLDSLPVIEFIEDTVVWICHQTGISRDTGEYYDVVYISTKSESGDTVRTEYWLSIDDVPKKMEKFKTDGLFVDSKLKDPIQSKDGRIKVYCENRYAHVSDEGDVIEWILDIDGIFARVVYSARDANKVVTKNVFDSVSILNISEK